MSDKEMETSATAAGVEKAPEGLKKRNKKKPGDNGSNGSGEKGARNGQAKKPAPAASAGSSSSSAWTLVLGVLIGVPLGVLLLLALGLVKIPDNSGSGGVAGPEVQVHVTERNEVRPPAEIWEREEVDLEMETLGERGEQWTEVISWEPRAFIYHNFLSKEECQYLIELASPRMVKSEVVDSETGKSVDSRVRTSSGTFLQRGQDKYIRAIERRIADFTHIPVENGEGLQVLHYEVGQKYEAHFDYFQEEFNTQNGGQRIATLLMYLSDVEEGGETVFPSAKVNVSSLPNYDELSECGKTGVAVRPKMGDALLFWSMRPDATPDPSSLHAGCPVIKGNKWSSTKWMRVNEYKA